MNAMAENGNREPSCFQTEAVSSRYDTASVFFIPACAEVQTADEEGNNHRTFIRIP